MFDRFTERARQAVVLAHEEARTLKHKYIGTEHILLGLLREEQGVAARVLESRNITFERVRAQVVRIVGSGEEVTSGQLPFTPRAKKVLGLAQREALRLAHKYTGTEHILLGLARANEGIAVQILLDFGADSEQIRHDVIAMLRADGIATQRARPQQRVLGTSGDRSGKAEQPPRPQPLAFLCHSSSDKDYIRRLDRRLRSDRITTWLDERDLLAGQEWDRAIREAVRAADVVVVCLSNNSINNSGYVQKEIRHVLDIAEEQPEGAIFVIPVKIAPCEVPDRLARWHWVDLRKRGGYNRLVAGIHGTTTS